MFSSWRCRLPQGPDLKALDFLAKHGFDFVRVPMDYRFWTEGTDYLHPNGAVIDLTENYLKACQERGIHLCLNLHRAPGYCINGNDRETHNLWADAVAQEAFVFLWESFAMKYKGVPGTELSFDLLNEPPNIGQYGMTREIHAALMRRTIAAIRSIDPAREITLDGLCGGNVAMPELADVGATHSTRGYQPMGVSHYRAPWCGGFDRFPYPVYPGIEWDGRVWDREALKDHYAPWREVQAAGAPVHVGEFGCFDTVSEAVALRWLSDLLSVYREFGWGYSLWEFEGEFGVIGHRRPGARFEPLDGYRVDRALFELLKENRV
jgi:hypothetical protein